MSIAALNVLIAPTASQSEGFTHVAGLYLNSSQCVSLQVSINPLQMFIQITTATMLAFLSG